MYIERLLWYSFILIDPYPLNLLFHQKLVQKEASSHWNFLEEEKELISYFLFFEKKKNFAN